MVATWTDVPRDVWYVIFGLLENNPLAIIRLGAVCSAFRSIASSDPKYVYRVSSPSLLTPRDAHSVTRDLFSLADPKRTYGFHLPHLQNRRCLGSSYGWLFTIDLNSDSDDCSLLNPVTNVHISLPPVPIRIDTSIPIYRKTLIALKYIRKVTISADPSQDKSFVVMLICKNSKLLFYCRPGDIGWTKLTNVDAFDEIHDAIRHKGKFYAVTQNGKLVSWNQCDIEPPVSTLINPTEAQISISRHVITRYLLNSANGTQLLMVCELNDHKFSVFKLDGEKNKFIKLQRLGDDQAVFLSPHCAFCVSTLGSKEVFANCIYSAYSSNFGSVNVKGYLVYVYNLDNKTSDIIYKRDCIWDAPCIWVIPSTKKSLHNIIKTRNSINKRNPDSITMFGESQVPRRRRT